MIKNFVSYIKEKKSFKLGEEVSVSKKDSIYYGENGKIIHKSPNWNDYIVKLYNGGKVPFEGKELKLVNRIFAIDDPYGEEDLDT